jgi:uncharacterized protein YggU (UPF0235/DUF167 family)
MIVGELTPVAKERPVSISVKAVPRAARDEIVGWLDGALKIRVAAPPQDGRANAALESLLAATLGLRRSAVRVAAGHGSARKRVEIDGIDRAGLERRLAAAGISVVASGQAAD